jgi:hypothetical protein
MWNLDDVTNFIMLVLTIFLFITWLLIIIC